MKTLLPGDAIRYPKFWDKREPMEYYYGKVENVLPSGLILCRFVGAPGLVTLKPESIELDERT